MSQGETENMSQNETENIVESVVPIPNAGICPVFQRLVIAWHVVGKLLRKVKPNFPLKEVDIQDEVKVPSELVEEYYRKVLNYENEGINLFKSTGIVLYEIFLQIECSDSLKECLETGLDGHSSQLKELSLENFEPTRKKERVHESDSLYHMLVSKGLVPILCLIISNLIERNNTMERYNSMVDLEEDLRMFIHDPARFVAHLSNFEGHLVIPSNRLYGRDQLMSDLRQRCKQIFSSQSQSDVFLISGYSGTGKSSLVWNIEPYFTQLGGFFISGKYDQTVRTAKPLSTIVAAFESYCTMVLQRDEKYISKVRTSIKQNLGSEINLLSDLIPSISTIVGTIETPNPTVKLGGTEAMNRLDYLFRVFARSISTVDAPILLFLDDIQWADDSSFRLIRSLLTDTQNTSLIFMGCYRDSYLGSTPSLDKFLNDTINIGSLNVMKIHLGNMDKTSVNEMVSDSLCLPKRLTRTLADTIHRKTSGNPLFLIQLFKSLAEEKLLRYSFSERRWEWDIEKINSKNISSNIVDLMTEKMLTLPYDVQYSIQIAACFGASCVKSDLDYLSTANEFKKLDIIVSLALAVEEGLMNRIGCKYVFSHDQIEAVAYSLVLRRNIRDTHLLIGRILCKRISNTEFRMEDFIAVDQMNFGSSAILDESEIQDLTRLNYRAGEKSIMFSDFSTGAKYFNAGKELIDNKMWQSNYDLCLELFTSSAETDLAIAQHESMYKTLDTVIKNARSFEDRLRPYYTLLLKLGTAGKLNEAISFGLEILDELGESFPASIDDDVLMDDLRTTRIVLDEYTEDSLLRIEKMTDERKVAAMQFLCANMFTAYVSRPDLLMLFALRMVRLSLSYGLCRQSPFAFALYGLIMIKLKEYKLGYRYGQISIKMMERMNANECLARLYLTNYSTLTVWCTPLELSLEPFNYAHKAAMLCGDVEFSVLNLMAKFTIEFLCGKPLKKLSEEFEKYAQEVEKSSQNSQKMLTDPYRQCILNLIGKSENPLILTGSVMNQDEHLELSKKLKHYTAVCVLNYLGLMLSYLFEDYNLAAERAVASHRIDNDFMGRFDIVMHSFFRGLNTNALARTTREKQKWMKEAKHCKKRLKEWSQYNPWNCQQKYLLLKAENLYSKGNFKKAKEVYDNAIDYSSKHRSVQDQAISCERAAIFHLDCGIPATALDYYQRAHNLYLEWGADAKASHVKAKMKNITI